MRTTIGTRTYFLLLCTITSFYCLPLLAQDAQTTEYLKKAGSYAGIYNGKVEDVYNPKQYANLPYYNNADFTEGEVTYKNNIYPGQQVRLDLYKEQLIILTPERHYRVVVNPEDVEKVKLYGQTFIWHNPPKNSKLKAGFYSVQFEGKQLKLFCKEDFDRIKRDMTFLFERRVRYYVLINNEYYTVKNKGSFEKIFPEYKRQINQFSKDNKLDFEQHSNQSMISLAGFCNELLISPNNQ